MSTYHKSTDDHLRDAYEAAASLSVSLSHARDEATKQFGANDNLTTTIIKRALTSQLVMHDIAGVRKALAYHAAMRTMLPR